jgi:hypothetical protein
VTASKLPRCPKVNKARRRKRRRKVQGLHQVAAAASPGKPPVSCSPEWEQRQQWELRLPPLTAARNALVPRVIRTANVTTISKGTTTAKVGQNFAQRCINCQTSAIRRCKSDSGGSAKIGEARLACSRAGLRQASIALTVAASAQQLKETLNLRSVRRFKQS